MYFKKLILLLFLIGFYIPLQAQFGIPTEVCPSETFNLTNPSSEPINYWDFCTGDLLETPSARIITDEIPNVGRPEGMVVVTDGINWYGFITNRTTNNIIRADFGSSLDNEPTYTNLGNISGVLDDPLDIEVVRSDGNWYALVSGYNSGELYRINFGINLNNSTPTAEVLGISGIYNPLWFDLKKDGDDFIAIVPMNNFGSNNQISMIRFQNGMNDASPTLINTTAINSNMIGTDVIKDGNNWYGLMLAVNGKVYHLTYGTNLYSIPSIIEITSNLSGTVNSPYDVEFVKDGKNFFALIQSNSSQTYRLSFGVSVSNQSPTYDDLGNVNGIFGLGGTSTNFLTVINDNSNWNYFVINSSGGTPELASLIRVSFPNVCNALQATSTNINPSGISYIQSGTYTISLNTYDNDLTLIETYTQDLTVKNSTVGFFEVSNNCLGETTIFKNTSIGSDANVLAWEWDFGDGNTSNLRNPTHQYTSSGSYNVTLSLSNIDGCDNSIQKTVTIPSVEADFEISSGACPGEITQFQNTSQTQNTGILTYRWLLNNGDELTFIENPTFTYPSEGNYDVNLIVYDETGCNSSITRTFNFVPAPNIAFTPLQTQANISTTFQDQSNGNGVEIVDWKWTFADITQSNLQNPTVTFPTAGEYLVTLTTKNENGCEATFSQVIIVDSTIITSLEELALNQNSFIVFPNPAREFVNLEYQVSNLNDYPYLAISNSQGQVFQTLQLPIQNIGKQQWQMDISNWESGIYFLKLYWQGEKWEQKLLILK